MSIPTPKVELGLDGDSPIFPGFTLDNLESGVLDNTEYYLAGGLVFYDVTDRVRNISINRGKSAIFANITAGQANISFNNHDRAFDPRYEGSPFRGNIVPRREIKIYSNDELQFSGWVSDWNLSYTTNGDSITDAIALDGFTILAGQNLTAGTPTQQLTGSRIEAILDDPAVNWDTTLRQIDPGLLDVGTQEIADSTNALNYLQQVTKSEDGLLYMSKAGDVVYKERLRPFNVPEVVDFNQTSGIPFRNVQVNYGAELLYNEISISRVDGGTAVASDTASQAAYGIRSYSTSDYLLANDTDLANQALALAERFSTPEYRFEALEVAVHALTPSQQAQVLGLELGSVARIQFTPNGIGDPIVQYSEIIRLENTVTPEEHFITFGFSRLSQAQFLLNDDIFGTLDRANVLGAEFNSWTLNDTIYGRLSAGMAVS
jgi:hypothetical protein